MRSRHCSRVRCHRSYHKGSCQCRCKACVKLTREALGCTHPAEEPCVKIPAEVPFTDEELKLLQNSPFKGLNDPYPDRKA
jgi:hypothetical protein